MASSARESIAGSAARVESCLRVLQRSAPDVGTRAHDVNGLLRDLQAGLERRTATDRARFERLAARVDGLDPRATLRRGFAIVQQAGGRRQVVNSVRRVKPGARLSVSVSDGAFWTEVS
jgi:exodeoxyribonuclease VII large subunit